MTLNVLIIELATNISVWIPVKVAFLVERVHNVLLLVTGQFANAPLVGEEIHLPNVSNVSLASIKKIVIVLLSYKFHSFFYFP